MACMSCSAQAVDAKFCTRCGADLTPQHIQCTNASCGYSYFAAQVKFTYCPKCGHEMPETSS